MQKKPLKHYLIKRNKALCFPEWYYFGKEEEMAQAISKIKKHGVSSDLKKTVKSIVFSFK
jgi:hypothetical protein